jgi:LysR family transcriptional activator of dmlA
MSGLVDLRMFAEIARAESMSLAASRIGMSPATISGRLKALEEHYGVSLVRRTTRSLALTDEGRILLERGQSLLDGFEDLERTLRGRKRHVSGSLVISGPLDFGRRYIAPLAEAFAQHHPEVEFRFLFDLGEPAADTRFDVGIRIGALKDSGLVTRTLGRDRRVTCATPAYLAEHGAPEVPQDLAAHSCLILLTGGPDNLWKYRGEEGEVAVRVTGRRSASDMGTLLDLALRGQGILRASEWELAEALAAGDLRPVLTEHEPEAEAIHLLSENRRLLPLRTARFIDFAVEHFRRLSCRPDPEGVAA